MIRDSVLAGERPALRADRRAERLPAAAAGRHDRGNLRRPGVERQPGRRPVPPRAVHLQQADGPLRDVADLRRARAARSAWRGARSRTTPLQALTLLNDPVFVEAARRSAGSWPRAPGTVEARIGELFRRCLAAPAAARRAGRCSCSSTEHQTRPARAQGARRRQDRRSPATATPSSAAAWTIAGPRASEPGRDRHEGLNA